MWCGYYKFQKFEGRSEKEMIGANLEIVDETL